MPTGNSQDDYAEAPPSPRRLLKENGWAMLAVATATLGVELGAFALGRGGANGVLAAIAASLLWVAMAAPALAAGAKDAWGAVLRAGTAVDASAVALLWMWLFARSPDGEALVTFVAAVKIYCVLLATGLAGISAGRLGRSAAGRATAAVAMTVVLLAALATPFWTNGLVANLADQARRRTVACSVYVNPFYSAVSAVVHEIPFAWNEAPLMYRITLIGDYAPAPPVPWYAAVIVWSSVAAALTATHALRRRRKADNAE